MPRTANLKRKVAPKTRHEIFFDGKAAFRGKSGWRCRCGYVYPLVPEEILARVQQGQAGVVYAWLEPLKKEHEQS